MERKDEALKYFENFRKNLIKRENTTIKRKTAFGKEIEISFNPSNFLVVVDDNYNIWDISNPKRAAVHRYSKDAWFVDFCTIESTGQRYHPAWKDLCPVLRNNFKNPIILTKANTNSDAVLSVRYISCLKVLTCRDGTFIYSIRTKTAIYDKKANGGTGALSLQESDGYKLVVPQASVGSSKLELFKNNKPTHKAVDLTDFFEVLCEQFLYKKGYSLHKEYLVIHRMLEKHLPNWLTRPCGHFSHKDRLADAIRSWTCQLQQNPEFYDLPYSEIELLALYNEDKHGYVGGINHGEKFRHSIKKHLEKGDTKAATNASFYGYNYPKSIKSLMLKAGLLAFPERVYWLIDKCIKNMGVDKTRRFISSVHDERQPDHYILRNPTFIKAFAEGLPVMSIKQAQKDNPRKLGSIEQLIFDTLRMQGYLSRREVEYKPSANLKELHDQLSRLYTSYKKVEVSAEMTAIKTVDTSAHFKEFRVGDLIIRSPHTAYELIEVGAKMRHCVASYASKFYYRQVEIVLLTNENSDYLACIEIRGDRAVQAKLTHNRPLYSNPKYLGAVMLFISENNIIMASQDFGEEYEMDLYHWSTQDKNEERMAIVTELQKNERNNQLGRC